MTLDDMLERAGINHFTITADRTPEKFWVVEVKEFDICFEIKKSIMAALYGLEGAMKKWLKLNVFQGKK